MDLTLFQESAFGDLVPIGGSLPNGRPWSHHAFLPRPLDQHPPILAGNTYLRVGNARAALAALDATAARLPNPRLFRTSTLRLEAQSTAALEGTYEPLARVLGADAEDAQDPSLREVLNYVAVAGEAYAWAEEGRTWGVPDLANLQGRLVAGTPGEREFSSQVRPIQVVIGRREGVPPTELAIKAARYVPPPPGPDLEARLRDLIGWMQTDHAHSIDPIVAAAMGHYTFEALHPFHDGNGRLGRLLIVLQLFSSGVLSEPTLSVSPWFEARRMEYYDALLGVSTHADWDSWISFFAVGLEESAHATRTRMMRLVEVQSALKEQLQTTRLRTANARVLIDYAVGQPTFTVKEAAQTMGMGHQGASKLIDSLVTHGILAQWGQRTYNRQFHAPAVMRVLLDA